MTRQETLAQLIIRDIMVETSGEIDLSDYEQVIEESIRSRVGYMRQWLNEDRVKDGKLVTNEELLVRL